MTAEEIFFPRYYLNFKLCFSLDFSSLGFSRICFHLKSTFWCWMLNYTQLVLHVKMILLQISKLNLRAKQLSIYLLRT